MEAFLHRIGLTTRVQSSEQAPSVELRTARQDWAQLTPDLCCHTLTPIRIGSQRYTHGLGAHANGSAVFRLNRDFSRFVAEVGVDNNYDTGGTRGSVVFVVRVDGQELLRTPVCRGGDAARKLDVSVGHGRELGLFVSDAGDGIGYDQADWGEARMVDSDGNAVYLSDVVKSAGKQLLLAQNRLPASFVYGGESSDKLLAEWKRDEKPLKTQDGRLIHEVTWTEPEGGLVVTWRAEVFEDAPAIEFRWIFENQGGRPAKVLSDVRALDIELGVGGQRLRLVRSSGGLTGGLSADDPGFAVSETPLTKAQLSAAGGRSSNKDLPFFLVHDPAQSTGVFVGIGWSGQWQVDLGTDERSGNMRITAGMPGTSLSLPPGERITSPSILLGLYDGDSRTGCNSLRRLLYDRYVPLLNGRKPTAPVSWNSWFVLTNGINEELLEREADVAAELGIEYFCIDAGWFDGDFPDGVGNWTVNRSKFPNGLGPIGKYVAAKGMKPGLWFEPERVVANSRLAREHPEWVHGDLLDLGNPAAREWILKMMRGYIDEGGVGWIRFDFNTDPLSTWNGLDAPETRGLPQIRHVMGLYDILDRLRADYPGLLIEGCASGGRRIDLETIKRSHTFWKSDETGSLPVMRFHETGGNVFLPGCLLNANLLAIDNVSSIHSLFGGPLGFGADLTKLSADAKDMTRKTIAEYKQLRGLLDMDYYPLFPQQRDQTGWIGWQFHDPATGKGFFVLLRPDGSPYESAQVHLGGLEKWSNKSVAITEVGSTGRSTMSGAELSRGWLARLLAPGDSKVFSYQIEPSAETRR